MITSFFDMIVDVLLVVLAVVMIIVVATCIRQLFNDFTLVKETRYISKPSLTTYSLKDIQAEEKYRLANADCRNRTKAYLNGQYGYNETIHWLKYPETYECLVVKYEKVPK